MEEGTGRDCSRSSHPEGRDAQRKITEASSDSLSSGFCICKTVLLKRS